MKGTSTRGTSTRTTQALRWLAILALLLLAIEFIFGTLVNLYVQIPTPLPIGGALGGFGWALSHGNFPTLQVHAALGILLILVGLISIGLAIASRRGVWIISSVIGTLAMIFAALSGAGFVVRGDSGSSLAMALGFLLALIAYAVGLYVTHPKSEFS